MKRKVRDTINAADETDLAKQITDAGRELASASLNRYTDSSKNTRARKVLRNKIALLSTVLRQKELSHEI